MSVFNYGHLKRQIPLKGYLPGQITKAFGPRYIKSGFWDSASNTVTEYGLFVEVNAGDDYAYEVLPFTSATTAGECAVVVRDIAGAQTLTEGIPVGPKEHVPLSLFIGTAGQKGRIVAICGEQNTTFNVAGQVYVGTASTANTIAGAVYTTNVNSECVTATNWKYAGTKFAPTTSGAYVVEVEYVG